MLVDSHCHLDFPELSSHLEDVLGRAREGLVSHMLTISTRIKQLEKILSILEQAPKVFGTVGTHPHHVLEESDLSLADILNHTHHPKIVGIGESGLDYFGDTPPKDLQKKVFLTHIEAARRTGLPLVVHSRNAEEDTAALLEEEYQKSPFSFVLHCFSSHKDLAKRGLALGGYVSFSGIITFKNAEDIREVARFVPLDRLLVETDAPYLAPVPMRGKTNEPAFVAYTLEALAALRGVSSQGLAKMTTDNFFRLFSKATR